MRKAYPRRLRQRESLFYEPHRRGKGDLDGAKASQPQNLKTLEAIASQTELEVEFGGGIKSHESLKSALDAGASYVVCGSVAVTNPEQAKDWMECYKGKIILGIDIKDGVVATCGWLEKSQLTADDLLKSYDGLVSEAEITEISRDGTLQGIDRNSETLPECADHRKRRGVQPSRLGDAKRRWN